MMSTLSQLWLCSSLTRCFITWTCTPAFCERLLQTSSVTQDIFTYFCLYPLIMLSTSPTTARLLLFAALSTQITNAMAQSRCYYDRYNVRRCYPQSAWNSWVRWVVLAVVVGGFLLLFFLCSCITARRRRKAGRTPFYGTGWAARPGNSNAQPYYNNQTQAPAPPYSAATNNNNGYYGGGANQSYYGQQNGVELQSPQPTYGGNQQYAPPPGPPPGKDGMIR
ncbi:uncharacterized protein EKO05_0000537 [Ascochyta rabiei]|nr:uncharacterized protein EKO05_0000537 [Ascochyta rabiei]UPX09856.1 hypothetical protein EKO05_0000537 [Ascochyta rabiei]